MDAAKGKPEQKLFSKADENKAIEAENESAQGTEKEKRVKEKEDGSREDKKEEDRKEKRETASVVAVLEKLEQAHYEQREELKNLNNDHKDKGLAKVGKMEEKIRGVKDGFRGNKKKNLPILFPLRLGFLLRTSLLCF